VANDAARMPPPTLTLVHRDTDERDKRNLLLSHVAAEPGTDAAVTENEHLCEWTAPKG
jgi:hypothetical protein